LENGEEVVDYKNKVEDLIESFNETKSDLDNLLKLQNACQRDQNKLEETEGRNDIGYRSLQTSPKRSE
jgi:hypothetical protein